MSANLENLAALYGPSPVEQLRVPPQAVEAEQAVLGGVMLVPAAWPQVSELLTESDFYRREHALAWRAISELADANKPFDALTVAEWFESNGHAELVDHGAYLGQIASSTPSAANVQAYAAIVREKAILRQLIELGSDIVNDGFQPGGRESGELVANATHRLTELQPAQAGGLRHAADSLGAWYQRFTELYHSDERMTGMPTPWAEVNEITHGLQPSTLYLVAARPSMGKSVFGLNLAMFAALRGKTVGMFSLEMSTIDCHNRNIAALGRIPHDWLIAPDVASDEDYTQRVVIALRDLKAAPLFIDDTASINVRQFEARARRMHQRNPLDLLVIDHIHDFRIDPKLARFEYGQIVQVGKNLAKEWGIPVVMLGQLNRNVAGRSDKRPTLSDLRESGELEQKGDVILFLHREDYYDTPDAKSHLQGVVELHFAKGRNIRAGARVHLRNRFDQMRLEDWDGPLPEEPSAPSSPRRGFGSARYSEATRRDA